MRRSPLVLVVTMAISATIVYTALAAPDRTVTVDGTTTIAQWDGTAAEGANFTWSDPTGNVPGQCGKDLINYCDDNLIKVDAGATSLKITMTPKASDPVPDPAGPLLLDDFDLYVFKSDATGAVGAPAGDGGGEGAGVPETVTIANPTAGSFYLARVVYFAVGLDTYAGKAELIGATGGGTTGPTGSNGTATATATATASASATATATASSTPVPDGATLPTSGTLTTSFAVDRTKRKTAARRGLRVRVRCSVQCKATALAVIDKKSARTLRLGKKAMKIGQGSATITKAGRIPFKVKLTKKMVKALKRKKVKKFTITVGIKVTDLQGRQAKAGNKKLTVKR